MALFLRLLRDVGLAYLGAAILGFVVTRGIDPLGSDQLSTLRLAYTWAVLVEFLLTAAAAWRYTSTFRRALARAASLPPEEALRAAISAHRLPIRMGLTVLAISVSGILAVSWRLLRSDAPDLALSGVAIGVATSLLVAMLCYSSAASRIARDIDRKSVV